MVAKKFGRFVFPSMEAAVHFLKEVEQPESLGAANIAGAVIDYCLTSEMEDGKVIVRTITANAYKRACCMGVLLP